jgi:predicted dehydrogenase
LPLFNVLIIGAGQVGAFYDQPDSPHILSHAHAFSSHPGFRLQGFFDSNSEQAQKAARIWGGEAFPDWEAAIVSRNIEVVVLAVPDEYHFPYLKALAAHDLRLLVAEKPLVLTAEQLETIQDLYAASSIGIAVNYSRRYAPEYQVLREKILSGYYGYFMTGNGYYGKGLLHNGSHMLDLLRYLIGEIRGGTPLRAINDWSLHDPSLSAILEFESGALFCMGVIDCRCYSIFEMELLFTKARIRIVDSGFFIEEYWPGESGIFASYRNLKFRQKYETSLNQSLYHLACNVYNYLVEQEPLRCTLEDAGRAVLLSEVLRKAIPS